LTVFDCTNFIVIHFCDVSIPRPEKISDLNKAGIPFYNTIGCIISSYSVSLILSAADFHQKEMSKAVAFEFESRQAINEKFAVLLKNVLKCLRMESMSSHFGSLL